MSPPCSKRILSRGPVSDCFSCKNREIGCDPAEIHIDGLSYDRKPTKLLLDFGGDGKPGLRGGFFYLIFDGNSIYY
jgi:hypothetical protein